MKKVLLVVILLLLPIFVNAENSKDMTKYSPKEVFLISDNSWKDVLRFVPATVWKEDGIIKKYPFLIYHDETNLPELVNFASSSIGAEIAAYNLEEHNYARLSSQFDDYIIPEGYDIGNLISNGRQVISEVIGSNPHATWQGPWLQNRYCLGHTWCGSEYYEEIPPFSVVLDLGAEREFDKIVVNTEVGNKVSIYSTSDNVNIHDFNSFNSAEWDMVLTQDTFMGRDSILNLPNSTSRYIRIDLSDNPLTQAWWGGDSDEDGNLEYDCPSSGEDEDHTIRGLEKLEVYSTDNEDSSERSNFDADSIVYFLQMYEPSKVTIISNNFETSCGDNLDNDGDGHVDLDDSDCQLQALLYDPEEFGGMVTSVSVVPSSQVLNYWEDYDSIVLVEDSYESSLLASSYASLINSPLIFEEDISSIKDPNLILHYSFDIDLVNNPYWGDVVTDHSGSENVGIINGKEYPFGPYSYELGKFGNALDFTRTSSESSNYHTHVSLSEALSFGYSSPFSVSLWAKEDPTIGSTWRNYLFGFGDGYGGTYSGISYGNGGSADNKLYVGHNSEWIGGIEIGNEGRKEWNHIVVTRAENSGSGDNSWNIYLNGQRYGPYSARFNILFDNLGFAAREAWSHDGLIDEVKVYNKELTEEEVIWLHHTNSLSNPYLNGPNFSPERDRKSNEKDKKTSDKKINLVERRTLSRHQDKISDHKITSIFQDDTNSCLYSTDNGEFLQECSSENIECGLFYDCNPDTSYEGWDCRGCCEFCTDEECDDTSQGFVDDCGVCFPYSPVNPPYSDLPWLVAQWNECIYSPEYNTGQNYELFEEKNVILVGDISCPEDANCVSYSIEELQEEYVSLTNTDKVILVNPNDKEEYIGEAFLNTDLSNNVVTSLYSMQSLAAPYLAAAKEELILFMDLPRLGLEYGTESQIEVEQHVNSLQQMMGEKIDSLFASRPEFITIIASPNYISNFRPLDSTFFNSNGCGAQLNIRYDMEEIENTVLNQGLDYKLGRIYGFTPSDASSYVARSVFYDDIMDNLYDDDEYTGLIVTDERHSEELRNWYRSAQHQTLNYLKPEYDLLDCFWKPRVNNQVYDYSYLIQDISEGDTEFKVSYTETSTKKFTRVKDEGPFNDEYPYILKLSSKIYENGEFIDYGQNEIVACDLKDGQWFRECERGYDESPITSHESCTYTSSSNAQEGDVCTWVNLEYSYPYHCEPSLASFSSNPELYNYFSWSAFDLEDNKNKQFISVGDHGGPNALSGYYVDSSQIDRYDLSYFFGGGCSTSDFFTGKQSTLGPNLLKRGVIGYHGAVEYANYFTTWAKVLCYATKNEPKTLGDLNNFVISQDPGDKEYTLLGDPTLVPRFRNNVYWEQDCEDIDGYFTPDW